MMMPFPCCMARDKELFSRFLSFAVYLQFVNHNFNEMGLVPVKFHAMPYFESAHRQP